MRLLLVEDEASAARRLLRLVSEHCGGNIDAVLVDSVEAAVDRLGVMRFDGILLDLNLGGADGFGVLRAADTTPVIVISAHVDRSLEAFDHAVLDFVAKPIIPARLARALDRLAAGRLSPRPVSLIVRTAGRAEIVECDQIIHIQGADDYAELFLTDGRRLLHDDALGLLERRLPTPFVRVHRSHIVNGAHATALTRDGGLSVALTSGDSVPVGRRRQRDVERWFAALACRCSVSDAVRVADRH